MILACASFKLQLFGFRPKPSFDFSITCEAASSMDSPFLGNLSDLFTAAVSCLETYFSWQVFCERVRPAVTLPNPVWSIARTAIARLALAVLGLPYGKCSGFLQKFHWNDSGLEWWRILGGLLRFFFAPSFFEELVWRAAFLPEAQELEKGRQ